jgi:hypothetical protein
MWRTLFEPIIDDMSNGKQITINLKLEVDGDTMSGEARTGSGSTRTFSSWLGLIGALDMLVGDGGTPEGSADARPGSVRQAR